MVYLQGRWKFITLAMIVLGLAVTPSRGFSQETEAATSVGDNVAKEVSDGEPSKDKANAKVSEVHSPKDEHGTDSHGEHGTEGHVNLGKDLPLWTVIPFVALLLSIAVFPLLFHHWWESNVNKGIVAAVLAIPIAAYLWTQWGEAGHHVLHETLHEYVSFIVLLAALYVISGGIYVRGSLAGTPLSNMIIMGIGAMLASLIGTTGASVVLIRPLLRANQSRAAKAHLVIFFIFIVSNCGGLLTPLGDPPLFLGFLKGVPFEWTLKLFPQWLFVNGVLLVVFNVWDQVVLDREERARAGSQLEAVLKHEPVGIDGWLNVALLGGIVATIFLLGQFGKAWLGDSATASYVRDGVMAFLAIVGYFATPKTIHEKNNFSFAPIIEVAVLFIGIFVTMAPALQILNAWGKHERNVFDVVFALSEPWQYFWATGILSSFLDNAPTYLTLAATACGSFNVATDGDSYMATFLLEHGEIAPKLLAAISCGAVFMGANTYIGNGPNFMVKAIAEENGVKMPSFFGYMVFSGLILVPLFIATTFVFFR